MVVSCRIKKFQKSWVVFRNFISILFSSWWKLPFGPSSNMERRNRKSLLCKRKKIFAINHTITDSPSSLWSAPSLEIGLATKSASVILKSLVSVGIWGDRKKAKKSWVSVPSSGPRRMSKKLAWIRKAKFLVSTLLAESFPVRPATFLPPEPRISDTEREVEVSLKRNWDRTYCRSV